MQYDTLLEPVEPLDQPRVSGPCPPPVPPPFTGASFALKALWNKLALRGELDPHYPPATTKQAG